MRRAIKHIVHAGCLLAFSLVASHALAENQTVRLCFENTSNPPFYYGERLVLDKHPGLTVDILREAAKAVGVTLQLERMPWKRCILLLQQNQIDGAFEVSYKSKREAYAVYPKLEGSLDQQRYLHSLSYYLYTLNNTAVKWDGNRVENIKSTLVGVAGYSIVGDLRAEGYPVLEGVSQKANLEMLLRGRVDGLAQIGTMTDGIIKNSANDKFSVVKKHTIPLRSKLYYLVFAQKFMSANRVVAEKLWDELAGLRQSGRYDEIAIEYAE